MIHPQILHQEICRLVAWIEDLVALPQSAFEAFVRQELSKLDGERLRRFAVLVELYKRRNSIASLATDRGLDEKLGTGAL